MKLNDFINMLADLAYSILVICSFVFIVWLVIAFILFMIK